MTRTAMSDYRREALVVTPDMARAWLEAPVARQRQLVHSHIRNLARQMSEGRFEFTPTPIMLGPDGGVVDGQHRLWAVVESGVPTRLTVAYDVPEALFDHIDKGVKRTASQFIQHRNRSTIAGAARIALLWFESDGTMRDWAKFTAGIPDELVLTEWDVEPVYSERAAVCAMIQKESRISGNSLLALSRLTWEGVEDEIFTEWAMGLMTGADLSQGDPRLTLRNKFLQDYRVLNGSGNRRRGWAYIVKAWNAHVQESSLTVLRYRMGAKNYQQDPGEPMPQPIGAGQ